jgi:hypothetical protein
MDITIKCRVLMRLKRGEPANFYFYRGNHVIFLYFKFGSTTRKLA